MTVSSFSLLTGETGPLVKSDRPDRLHVSCRGFTPLVSTGDQVLAGTPIAKALTPGLGDLHAPLEGTAEEISPQSINITVTGTTKADPIPPPTPTGQLFREWLRGHGVNVTPLVDAPVLIINAVPPEPGIHIYEPLLRDYRKTLELGLEAVQQIVAPSKAFLVTARGNRTSAFANCTVLDVAPTYPNGLDPLVIKTVTGKEILPGAASKDAVILSVRDLFLIGRVMETGRPVTETVLTIGGAAHLLPIGTPVGFLTAGAGVTVQAGDRIILGGLFRGTSALNLAHGIDKDTTGLHLVRNGEGLTPTDHFCLGCGECERHCPARIMPGMISRCAEFKKFERAEYYHIHSCIECGLCAYYCKAQRPLLQYIRLAKQELALLRNAAGPAQEQRGHDETADNGAPA